MAATENNAAQNPAADSPSKPASTSAPAGGVSAVNGETANSESVNNESTNADAANDSAIIFTENAADRVRQLIAEEGVEGLCLRVFIAGGGCSGFQYGFTFDEEVAEDDTVLHKKGVKVLIDPMSCQYLVGAEIDYQEKLEGSQFVIRNPNVTSTCGCGSSFAV